MRRILTPAEFRAQPWKNGRGITHEIIRWPDDPGRAYDVRMSLAEDRDPGPFSQFPGYRRWSFLAGPAPIVLTIDGLRHELRSVGDHVDVPGDAVMSCTLPGGPTRLLSVLVRDRVGAVVGSGPCGHPIRVAYALAPLPWLAEGHAAVFEPPEPMPVTTHGVVWIADGV